jgi:hypothetical protein
LFLDRTTPIGAQKRAPTGTPGGDLDVVPGDYAQGCSALVPLKSMWYEQVILRDRTTYRDACQGISCPDTRKFSERPEGPSSIDRSVVSALP